ncbi:MAG: hypothetical protein AAGD43_01840 [Pseudomonadota bacterium]
MNFFPDAQAEYARKNAFFAVITILDVEFEALKYVFGQPIHLPMDSSFLPFEFYAFRFEDFLGSARPLICCSAIEPGNNAAAIAATALHFGFPNLEQLFVCGIAAGMPVNLGEDVRELSPKEQERHVSIGDVVISTEGIFQYDNLRLTGRGGNDHRVETLKTTPRISGAIKAIQSRQRSFVHNWRSEASGILGSEDCPWNMPDMSEAKFTPMYLNNRKPMTRAVPQEPPIRAGDTQSLPHLHFGIVGSANILLRDFRYRDRLLSDKRILAIEMEGSGVNDTAWTFGKSALAVRGCCDFADMNKGDHYHELAAINAAAVLKDLLTGIK